MRRDFRNLGDTKEARSLRLFVISSQQFSLGTHLLRSSFFSFFICVMSSLFSSVDSFPMKSEKPTKSLPKYQRWCMKVINAALAFSFTALWRIRPSRRARSAVSQARGASTQVLKEISTIKTATSLNLFAHETSGV